MASFDIVNKVDAQLVDNVVNVVRKEITSRYDFKDSKTTIELDKKNLLIQILTENTMKLGSIEDVLISRALKQQVDPKVFDFSKEETPNGALIKKEVKVRQGIDKEIAKKIIKIIKDSKAKVDAVIQDEQVRVSSKKIDELQAVIAVLRQSNLEIPLQFINMK
ncbi:MAG: hypothetical protein RLZZ175_2605 [Bacteroidota bacterium]|jgi:uncharacterized protein YajQ (UPF0234 family)